jgi:tRNA (cmo5U34)-methyltransferase
MPFAPSSAHLILRPFKESDTAGVEIFNGFDSGEAALEQEALELSEPELMAGFFDARVEGYNRHMLTEVNERMYPLLGACFPVTEDAIAVLDIGCGTGMELAFIFANAPNARITCVDVSRGMLDELLRSYPDRHGQITAVQASYLDWPYPEESFDIVVSNQTMHHFFPEEKKAVYRKILSALKPGGFYVEGDFMVDEMLSEQYLRRYEAAVSRMAERPKPGEYHIDIPFTAETQRRLLMESGFGAAETMHDETNERGGYAILRALKTCGGRD